MINLQCSKPVLFTSIAAAGAAPLAGRVARLKASLAESMLRKQETWKPASLADDPATARLPLLIRRAAATARVLHEMPLEIAEDEWLVGKTARDGIIVRTSLPEFALEVEKEKARAEGFDISGGLSHKTPDYPTLLSKGLGGILIDIAEKKIEIARRPDSAEKTEKLLLMEAMEIECRAVIDLAQRYAELAERMAEAAAAERAGELRQIAAICRRVPEYPAQTFQEALQSVWMVHFAFFSSHTNLSLGRFDQYCGLFLENDLAAGNLTLESAQELVDCLWIKFNDRAQILRENFAAGHRDHLWQAGCRWRTILGQDAADAINHFGQNLLLSGIRPDGEDGTNALTWVMLNSMERFEYTSPVVTIRLHRGSPPELLRRTAEVLKKGGGMPYIDNDDAIIPAYMKLGVPLEDARDYSNSNCWETMIAGKSDQELIRGFNFLLILEWVLNRGVTRCRGEQEGIDSGDPRGFAAFDEVMAAWKRQMDVYLEKSIDYIGSRYTTCDLQHSNHGRYAYNPLLSALTQDCIAKEQDIIRGGARYAIWHCMAEAVANCIDALAAIKKLVFDEKIVSMDTLLDALASNWQGSENLRQQVIACAPKYANDQAYADEIGQELLGYFVERTRHHARRYPAILFPCAVGTFSWYTSIGREVGASSDGRFAQEPITPNFSPSLGMDLAGPNAAIRSYCKMYGADLAGGAPFDLRFAGSHLRGEAGTDRLAAFMRVFIALGGNMMTLTVTDAQELKRAMLEPMNYRGLRVRMGGWTAYFIALNPEQQRLHIARVEHGV
jgi:choline trimethylamine-lyase